MYRKCILLFLVYAIITVTPTLAATEVKVPEPLKPWVDWVLEGHEEELLCTPNYNDAYAINCNWPTALDLDIAEESGSFSQSWLIEHESWIQLPGNDKIWPQDVTINGKPAITLKRHGVPQIKLQAGNYKVKGKFSYQSIPEFLQVNSRTALLSLSMKGKAVEFPSLDDSGRLWLHAKKKQDKTIEDSLQVKAFRMIDDRIPARLVLSLSLDVAGSPREVLLGAPFSIHDFIPISINSSLPARLEKDGRIRLQIRPGQWQVTLTSRHIGPLSSLNFTRPDDEFWPQQEIWVFAKQNNRIVEIEGGNAIDPQQTTLPHNWRNLPAYRVQSGDTMKFKVRIFASFRGRYRAVVRYHEEDDGFDMVTLDEFPLRIKSLPFKERRYLEYHTEGSLGTAARKAITIGESRGIEDDCLEFLKLAYNESKETIE